MATWVLGVAALSIAATAALAWILMRINAPPPERQPRSQNGADDSA
jgi:hypothetical protein